MDFWFLFLIDEGDGVGDLMDLSDGAGYPVGVGDGEGHSVGLGVACVTPVCVRGNDGA